MDTLKGRMAAVGGLFSALSVGMVLLASGANATTDPVDTAFGDIQDKSTHYAGLLIALVAAVVVLLVGIAWLRKGRTAAH